VVQTIGDEVEVVHRRAAAEDSNGEFRRRPSSTAAVKRCSLTLELPWTPCIREMIVLALTWIGLACWVICFCWMHRISARQDALLKELHEMTRRIEHFSREEHELIQEVHPRVSEIKEQVEHVAEAVGTDEKVSRNRGEEVRAG
jgi:hypothetical protein